jgi:hypothetical protein
MLKRFNVNSDRDLLAPDFACYQMDLSGPVNDAIASGEIEGEFELLPSWNKFIAHPLKGKGFFTRMLRGVFMGQANHDELNADLQAGILHRDFPRVAMMFMPSNTRNDALEIIGGIAHETLGGFEIIVLCGSVKHNGKKITNRNAERVVMELIETGKPILIIASQMAQRSFSIPKITELYLAYDRGANGATIQKMSRTLTPGNLDKIGSIFSLSFDPNRDDKFDAMIVETALNYKSRTVAKSLRDAMRDVLQTIDIFECREDGAIKMDIDHYLELAMGRNGITRVIGKIINLHLLTPEEITAIASGDPEYFRNPEQNITESGKVRNVIKPPNKIGTKTSDPSAKEMAEARKVIVTILENLDILILGTGTYIIADAMETLRNSAEMQMAITEEFGIPSAAIEFIFDRGIIKQDWVELLFDKTNTAIDMPPPLDLTQ